MIEKIIWAIVLVFMFVVAVYFEIDYRRRVDLMNKGRIIFGLSKKLENKIWERNEEARRFMDERD